MGNNSLDFLKQSKSRHSPLLFAIIVSLLLILLVVFARYLLDVKYIIENDELSYKHLNYTDELTIQILSIETGARGYLLSNKVEFLEPFYRGTQELSNILKLTDGAWPSYLEKDQVTRLETNLKNIVRNLTKMVQKNYENGAPANLIVNLEDYSTSKKLMDELRLQLNEIKHTIQRSIKDNQKHNIAILDLIKWVIFLLFSIAFLLLYSAYTQTQKQQKLAMDFADMTAMENQNLESKVSARTAELMSLASYMTSTTEEERKRIARELHDELGALLTAARMDASWISKNLKDSMDKGFQVRIERLINTISEGIKVKRNITSSLVPPLLKELGLFEAINALTEDSPDQSPPIYQLALNVDLDKVDDDRALAIYRICQESLTNIRKYAHATHVLIKLDIDDNNIKLLIEDDGDGFNMSAMKKGTHGLTGMDARAAMFGGVLNVESSPNFGTKVSAWIPLH